MADEDDIDFEAWMRRERVAPLRADRGRPGRLEKTGSAKGRVGTSEPPRPGEAASRSHDADPQPRKAAPSADDAALAARRADLEAREADLAAREADLATRHAAFEAREADLAERHAALEAREADLAARRAEFAARQAELEARGAELAIARERGAGTGEAHAALEALLDRRGVAPGTERESLLRSLARDHAAAFLRAAAGGDALAQLLERRVALVCERSECQPSAGTTVLSVPPERCEVCEGSDVKLAFEMLLTACRSSGVTRLAIVGGSPAYHTQLRQLAAGRDLKLELVSGVKSPGRRRARTSAQRVVLWGATMLDHSTSAAYAGLANPTIRVAHRGLSRMLLELAEQLEATRPA